MKTKWLATSETRATVFNCTILNQKSVVIQPPFLQRGQSYTQVFSIMSVTVKEPCMGERDTAF